MFRNLQSTYDSFSCFNSKLKSTLFTPFSDSSSFFTPTTVAWQELDRWAYKAEINFLDFAAAAESFESVVNYREKLISR